MPNNCFGESGHITRSLGQYGHSVQLPGLALIYCKVLCRVTSKTSTIITITVTNHVTLIRNSSGDGWGGWGEGAGGGGGGGGAIRGAGGGGCRDIQERITLIRVQINLFK